MADDKVQEDLIGSIVRNIQNFKNDFDREAVDCPHYDKGQTEYACKHPKNRVYHCYWHECPLR